MRLDQTRLGSACCMQRPLRGRERPRGRSRPRRGDGSGSTSRCARRVEQADCGAYGIVIGDERIKDDEHTDVCRHGFDDADHACLVDCTVDCLSSATTCWFACSVNSDASSTSTALSPTESKPVHDVTSKAPQLDAAGEETRTKLCGHVDGTWRVAVDPQIESAANGIGAPSTTGIRPVSRNPRSRSAASAGS